MSTDESNAGDGLGELIEVKSLIPEVLDPENAALAEWTVEGDEVGKKLSEMAPFLENPILEAVIPWFCEALKSPKSEQDYLRDMAQFWLRMRQQGTGPLEVVGDDVRRYYGAMVRAKCGSASISRYLSVIRGVYLQFAIRGMVPWDVASDIKSIKGPEVERNSTPALSSKQAEDFLNAIPRDTKKGKRDVAMFWTYLVTASRVSAVIGTRVGDLNHDGVKYSIQLLEKRSRRRNVVLLDAAAAVHQYMEVAGIKDDIEGPLFRPMTRDGLGFERRFMDRRSVHRLVKHYCKAAGIDANRLDRRGISPHSLRKTALNDAIANGSSMTQVQALAGHQDIRTTQLYYVRKEEDAEQAARRIHIRPAGF